MNTGFSARRASGMTDSHCHLDRLEDPAAGVDPDLKAIVTVGTSPARNDAAIALAASHPNVWAVVGIHPGDAELAADADVLDEVRRQARQPRVVGIGETGFDTHWEADKLREQQLAFDFQAELAAELDLPLVLHVRDRQGGRTASEAACLALANAGWRRGVLHCFNGDAELLELGLELGWYVSFAGNVTYKNATILQEAASEIPPERLLLETDSPYLAPVPKRGRRNTPAYVWHTAAFVADLRGIAPEELERATDANAARLFGLPAPW